MAQYLITNLSQAPESVLIHEMAAGNSGALDELYTRYGPAIFSFLMARTSSAVLAEEVLQDVMLAAWRSAGGFRGESKVLTWLLTIARNRAINAQRRQAVPVVALPDDTSELRASDTGPLERVIRQGDQQVVRDTLNQLPDHLREVLVLVFYHQLSEAEVAEVLGIPAGTVKSRLHRAKEALRKALQVGGKINA
ncbi:MAG: sigma-70 family RNA polymerase sigma factor [Chloroflexi bacterium]|nr:sigma-70 family RNA polymerase sigma factor [Chloroflexota bacterium]